jgi:hypothetical protein
MACVIFPSAETPERAPSRDTPGAIRALARNGIILFLSVALPAAARADGTDTHHIETQTYTVAWLGMSVGDVTVREETQADGIRTRSLSAKSYKWASAVHTVDYAVRCVTQPTPEGPRHTLSRTVSEDAFHQHDTLTLWPETGRCVWSNALSSVCATSSVPVGAKDAVSFFFDLRNAFSAPAAAAATNYLLVADGAAHTLALSVSAEETLKTRFGKVKAANISAVSKSPAVFTRNKPKAIWVATGARPAVLRVDVRTRMGTVRLTLDTWTRDGQPQHPEKAQ